MNEYSEGQVEYFDDKEVLRLNFLKDQWHHSEFPTPFTTIDYNRQKEVLAVESVKPDIDLLQDNYKKWLANSTNPQDLVNLLHLYSE
jgi:hypothetical protein